MNITFRVYSRNKYVNPSLHKMVIIKYECRSKGSIGEYFYLSESLLVGAMLQQLKSRVCAHGSARRDVSSALLEFLEIKMKKALSIFGRIIISACACVVWLPACVRKLWCVYVCLRAFACLVHVVNVLVCVFMCMYV